MSSENYHLKKIATHLSEYYIFIDKYGVINELYLPLDNNNFLNIELKKGDKIDNTKLSSIAGPKLIRFFNVLKESGTPQEIDFITDGSDKRYISANFSQLDHETFLLNLKDITPYKEKEKQYESEMDQLSKKVNDLEKDMEFFIKQGDLVVKQRAKVQSERDLLATEKSEMLVQKKRLEQDLDFIMKQGDKIAEQAAKIKKQRDLVESQKKKITNSILYAKKIQTAVLPPNQFINHLLSDYFIFYKPRDIVSGDFYWIKQINDRILIAAADCTGHGVPGALMSMLGITFLNEIINKNPNLHAHEILNELRIHIISSLRQTGKTGETRDGMDIALCIINNSTQKLEYAGANNPLYHIRGEELTAIKADRMPIGYHRRANVSFQNHVIELEENDSVYLFSDGFIDQFGGEDGRKFLSKNFKKLILENIHHPMVDQKNILENKFESWKGERKQLDDILVMGFKLSFHKKVHKSKINYNWKGKTILIAEDDKSNYILLDRALAKTNAHIIIVENGKDAVKTVKSNPGTIDLILMDIRMPEMDGIEATQLIKEYKQDIPIIVQTAFTMSSEKEKSFKAGCDDYISKPINIKELYSTLCKYLEQEEEE